MSGLTSCNQEQFERLIDNYVENTNIDKHPSTYVSYGTAGFRGHADRIRPLVRRIGICAGLRSFVTNENTGIMVTASHNPIQDNGVKIIDGSGQMLSPKWESIFEMFVNIPAVTFGDEILKAVKDLARDTRTSQGRVIIGCDTRPTSEEFVGLLKEGLDEAWRNYHQIECLDLGVVTTPALHYLVGEAPNKSDNSDVAVQDYYDALLVNGFVNLNKRCPNQTQLELYDPSALVVDCANGVGQKTMQYLLGSAEFKRYLPAELINFSSKPDDVLNHECGADYVKTKQLPPRGANELNKRYASLDGDADRLVYFFLQDKTLPNAGGDCRQLYLLDGDKILCLFVKYLTDMLKKYNLTHQLSLGAIQTAYANGASTDYLREQLGVDNIECTDTGVKNLHRKALDYDLSVYFEANGHGTIHVSDKARKLFEEHDVKELQQLLSILNDYTGDAVSDILIAETILKHYDWDIKRWYDMYHDRANSLIKVEVKDRNVVETTNAGRTCLEPKGLQEYIDGLLGTDEFGPRSRSFVRASGTENIVRIYAEAKDQELADRLSKLVGEKVIDMCNTI